MKFKNENKKRNKMSSLSMKIKPTYLTSALAIAGWICAGIIMYVGNRFPEPIIDIGLALTFIFWGMAGLPIVIYREIPRFHINETVAVIYGVILMLIGLIVSSAFIFSAIVKLFFR